MNPRRGAVLLLLAVVLGRFLAPVPPRGGRGVSEAEALRLVPGGATAALVESPVPHREVRGEGAGAPLLGRVAASSVVAPVEGYGGPLDVLVAVDPAGRVMAVEVRGHQETPSYVAGLFDASALAALRGATALSPLLPGEDVDARSGATVSQGALLSAVRGTLRGVAGAASLPGTAGLPGTGTMVRVGLVIVSLGLGWWSWRRGQSAVRLLALAAGAAAGALGVFLSMESLYPPLLDGRCGAGPAWLLLAVGTLVAGLVLGRLFCGTVCPFGALQELVGVAAGRAGPDGLSPRWRGLRYAAAALLFVLAGMTAERASFIVDPIFLCLTLDATQGALVLWLGVVAASLMASRLWCRVLCPVGALLSAVGCRAPSPLVVTDACVGCGACVGACPMGCLTTGPSPCPSPEEGGSRVHGDVSAGVGSSVPAAAVSPVSTAVVLDAPACILCGACRRACPAVALVPGRAYAFAGGEGSDHHAPGR